MSRAPRTRRCRHAALRTERHCAAPLRCRRALRCAQVVGCGLIAPPHAPALQVFYASIDNHQQPRGINGPLFTRKVCGGSNFNGALLNPDDFHGRNPLDAKPRNVPWQALVGAPRERSCRRLRQSLGRERAALASRTRRGTLARVRRGR